MDWFLYDIGLRRERVKNSSTSFETDLSDHQHLIYSMLKIYSTLHKEEPIMLIYRDYKTFSRETFSSKLFLKLESQENNDYQIFEINFVDTLNNQAPKSQNSFEVT